MVSCNQYGRGIRVSKVRRITRSPALCGHPYKSAVVEFTRIMKPKKPNSAQRKTAKVRVWSTDRRINCYIPGIGHNLRKYSKVLVRGGRVKDLPGIQYHLVRGKFDFSFKESIKRVNKKTKYGLPGKDREILSY